MEALDRFPQYDDPAEDNPLPAGALSPEERFVRELFGAVAIRRVEAIAEAVAATQAK